jgi:iron complex outermembrane receptor protein
MMISACAIGARVSAAEAPGEPSATVQEVIVTAQKRAQNINDVGMSINAVSGEALVTRGAQDPAQLTRVVPGFQYNANAFGTPIYSLRGVGFQDSTLAASPTVTVYTDEVPIPFSAETIGAGLDVERLEVLKGPQGTLYGENATGGALNFITAKPTRTFQAGLDASYGRFSTADVSGYVSGPLGDTLSARLSVRALEGGNWQKSYTTGATLGQQNLLQGRLLIDWRPIDRLRFSLNLNVWQDRSDSPAPQLIGVVGLGSNAALLPALVAYPDAPQNARAADWDPNRPYARNNIFYMGALRADYDVTSDVLFSLISSVQRYTRHQPIEADGTTLQDLYLVSHGSIDTWYEEARLAGSFDHRGHWIVGANYEDDKVYDAFFEQFGDSTSRSIFGFPLDQTGNFTDQHAQTYAAYASGDYDIVKGLTLQGGVRYTKADRGFTGCSYDTNGQAAAIFDFLQQILKGGSYIPIPKGGCINLDANHDPALASGRLDQDNVSWRVGLNWKATPDTLLYANVSQGYKAGSYPTLSASSTSQFVPVVQESLIAYEAGFKSTLVDHTLQLNGAVFYYDYRDKQILGRINDPVFGPLLTLVNIPKSHIIGAELQAQWRPISGLTITPDFTYIYSRVDGDFINYDQFGVLQNFTGEAFPYTPNYQASVDAEYTWTINDQLSGYVGGDLSYQSVTNGALGNASILEIKPYTLLDLRLGVQSRSGAWRLGLWGRNVTDTYYWTTAIRDNDTINRYAGMPATYGVSFDYRFR